MFLALALLLACPAARPQSPLPPLAPSEPPPPGQTSKDHRLKVGVDLVVLHVTVADDKGQFVPGLTEDDFRVSEDKIDQKISFFSSQDIPVTMGLVIDSSGSMKEKRDQVDAAAMTFVKTSNPQDEEFLVDFNDEFYLDTEGDFTNDRDKIEAQLASINQGGSTAFYDAVIASLDHVKKGHKDKRVLLVVTDGEDDASRKSFEDAIRAAQQSDATIYPIGVFSEDDRKNDKRGVRNATRVLKQLAEATGGEAYFPADLAQVEPICEQVAREIRNQYTIGYYPSNTKKDGTFRSIQLQLTPPKGYGKLSVRTRAGYYAQQAPSSAD